MGDIAAHMTIRSTEEACGEKAEITTITTITAIWTNSSVNSSREFVE
ncbi:hypothetical protein [Terrabacter aerolatus]|nr:hypothetical protein [Terrabacter aerolatus]